MSVNESKIQEFVETMWDTSIVKALQDYIRIPNQSPFFDPEVFTNGYQEKAVDLMVNWVKSQKVPGLSIEVIKEKNRTPLIFIEVEGTGESKSDESILMYGHLDKQPPLEEEWSQGLGPYSPVIKNGKLYGRGGADDGYAIFASVCAIKALKTQKASHSRIVVVIEACEESGSPDLPFYINKLTPRIGDVALVICLDSGAGNYDQLWLTTSLRGMIVAEFEVKILDEGVHSGAASGIVPSSFRIMRELLDRVEDSKTGKLLVPATYCTIPEDHKRYAKLTAETLGEKVITDFPFTKGAKPMTEDFTEAVINRTWRPTLSYTGVDGMPALCDAGNVLRTHTALNLSIRLPPDADPKAVEKQLREKLTKNVPYGAKATLKFGKSSSGWKVPKMSAWLKEGLQSASTSYFKAPFRAVGEGGSIPFMGMLGKKFPSTQFVITGVLGPHSNAHGPNEFLEIDFAKKITMCVASILNKQYQAANQQKKRKIAQ